MVRIPSGVAVAVEGAAVLFELRGCGGRRPEGGFPLNEVGLSVSASGGFDSAVTVAAFGTRWREAEKKKTGSKVLTRNQDSRLR